MKKKNIKNKIKKEVKKFLKEQKQISFKVSEMTLQLHVQVEEHVV